MTIENFLTFKKILAKNPLMATVKLARYKFVSKMLDKNDYVVDVGCGGGLSTFYYSNFCRKAVGIDNDARRIKEWKEFKNKKLDFVNLNALDISKLNFDVNCIINVDFIEHITKKEGIIFIKNCKKFLQNQKNRRNKMLIIGTPSYYSKNIELNITYYIINMNTNLMSYMKYAPKLFKGFKFTMNDELVHTGFDKLGWFFFLICIL